MKPTHTFAVDDRVRFNAKAAATGMGPRRKGKTVGTVTGLGIDGCGVFVKFDGFKCAERIHCSYIERAK